MLRWISFILIFVLLVFVAFSSYLFMHRADFLAAQIAQALKVPVSIESITMTSANGLEFNNMMIMNPTGCSLKKAFSVDKIAIKASWKNVIKTCLGFSSEPIQIEEIWVNKPYLSLELFSALGQDNNWKRIFSKVATTKKETESRAFVVNKLLLTDIQVEVKNRALQGKSLKPPVIVKIEINNLGNSGPLGTRQLLITSFEAILVQLASQLQLSDLMTDINALPNLLNNSKLPTNEQELKEKLKDTFNDASEKLKQLFN